VSLMPLILSSAWRWPDIEGLESFKGPRLHSANWDDSVGFDNKRIGLIGNGSSAIQILPELQPIVQHMTTFIRTKTWVALPFTSEKVKQQAGASTEGEKLGVLVRRETANPAYSEDQRRRFRDDPEYLRKYRKEIEHENNARFAFTTFKDSAAAAEAIQRLTDIMKKRLERKPELAELLIPEWNVGCRRRKVQQLS
jgi:cation diffusion facilitator CzcD-associated flavoprotein CzcO